MGLDKRCEPRHSCNCLIDFGIFPSGIQGGRPGAAGCRSFLKFKTSPRDIGFGGSFSGASIIFVVNVIRLAFSGPRAWAGAAVLVLWPATVVWPQTPQFTNDFGNIGLMQTSTARLAGEGELRMGYSRALPYDFIFLSAQPYDWMEATFRYSEFNNRPTPQNDAYLDKSFDFKFRLSQERGMMPEVALGLQDIGGTGLLSGEYLVASKRWGDFDMSLGLGWGRLGSRGDVDNPLGELADRFNQDREVSSDINKAGSFSLSRLFTGRNTALFGGVRWQPEGAPYAITVEREGNDYKSEPFGNDLEVHFPVNLGVSYRLASMDLGLSYERGDQVTFHWALATNLEQEHGPDKVFDPPPTPVSPQRYVTQSDGAGEAGAAEAETQFVEDLRQALARQAFTLVAVDFQRTRGQATIWFRQGRFRNPAQAAGRVARSAASLAPQRYHSFTMVASNDSIEEYRITMERAAIRAAANAEIGMNELSDASHLEPPSVSPRNAGYDDFVPYPNFDWGMGPKVRQNVGDPNGFYYGQLWWSVTGEWELTDRLSINGGVGFNIVNNFDDLERESNSELPHVRSDVKEYLQEGKNNLVRLEANYIWPIAPQWYGRVSAGIFEEMYGGVAAEVLYRPFGQRWAAGVNINRVRQRDYDQRFAFRDYEVTTGHATLYYQYRPMKMRVITSVGRYLAGDYGATLDVSREFSSGARIGVFATKTDVSAEEFGEGSFDKGFYITIPLDMFFPRSVKRTTTFFFRPLTRDGGQKVDDGRSLYGETGDNSLYDFADGWPQVMK